MTPLTSKIYKIIESKQFNEFIAFFKLKHFYQDEKIVFYNNCYIVLLYTEYEFPFMELFHFRESKRASVGYIIKSNLITQSIYENIMSKDYTDYIDNISALKRIYYYFEVLRICSFDVFNCQISEKYLRSFEPFDPERYRINNILKKIIEIDKIK